MPGKEVYHIHGNHEEESALVKGIVEALTPQMSLARIRTEFVRDRLKETSWDDRGYIEILMHLEDAVDVIRQGKSWGWSGAMLWNRMKKDFPVEYECIKLEMIDGKLTSPEESMRLKTSHVRETARREAEAVERSRREAEARQERQAELREQWRELGGRD